MARKSLEGMRTSADPAPRLFCLAELNKYYRQSGNIPLHDFMIFNCFQDLWSLKCQINMPNKAQ
jgi:hypothetical protein